MVSLMDEYSRIIIEQYCATHKSAKSRRIAKLLEMSYDPSSIGTDADALFLEKAIDAEKNEELKAALQDLDQYLFGW